MANIVAIAVKLTDKAVLALDRYDIPYEMWSLDKGDYSMFGFEKNLDRYVTEGTDTILKTEHHNKVEGWVDRYIEEFNEV